MSTLVGTGEGGVAGGEVGGEEVDMEAGEDSGEETGEDKTHCWLYRTLVALFNFLQQSLHCVYRRDGH